MAPLHAVLDDEVVFLYKAVHAFASEQQTKAEKRDAVDAALAQRMLPPQEMLKRIKKSFQVAKGKQQLRHESNPNLTAVKVWSVVPHFSMYQHTHALAEFGYNPTELVPRKGEKKAARAARQADKQQRMLRSIVHNVTAVKGRSAVDEQRMIGSVMLPKRARERDSEGEGEDGQEFEWDNNSELVLKADKNDASTLIFSHGTKTQMLCSTLRHHPGCACGAQWSAVPRRRGGALKGS